MLDRGFIFGDGVYEVVAVYGRKLFSGRSHVKRLLRSLSEVSIASPHDEDGWLNLLQSVVENNSWDNQSVSNIFIVRGGVIATPPKNYRILAGVTRDITIEVARTAGLSVEERAVSEPEVRAADEMWLTTSPREILPITTLDKTAVGHGDSA